MRSLSLSLALIFALILAVPSLAAEPEPTASMPAILVADVPPAECAAVTPASVLSSGPAQMSHLPCCLEEWQGGGVCPPGKRLASYCSSPGCESCGTFFCYSGLCLQ